MQKVVDLVLRDQGYEVASVNTGQEAMDYIAAGSPPDLILAYIKLPGGDGYQISQQVKGNAATQHIPVILLAGAFDPVDEGLMAQAQANGSIVKPFQAEDLLKVIKEHIGEAAPAAAAPPAEEAVMFEGEQAADSFAGVGTAQPAESFADVAAPAAAAPVMAEPVMEAEPVMAAPVMEAAPVAPVAAAPAAAAPVASVASVDSAQIEAVVKQAVESKVSEAMAAIDIKDLVMQALEPQAKEVLEKLAYESVPEFLDRILRTNITETLSTVNKELENIIWETVPELAEEILKKEMERIRQESQ